MATTIRLNAFDTASVSDAIRQLELLRSEQDKKVGDACMRLAEYGANRARTEFSTATYDGNNDVTVNAEPIPFGARVRASGEAVLFIEYGAGATTGYGHPRVGRYGPGTYNPLSDNWKNPNGWYYAHGKKSWGNPPACAMYNAEQDMYYRAYEIASEVFK